MRLTCKCKMLVLQDVRFFLDHLWVLQASSSLNLKPSVEQRLSSTQQQALYVNRVLLQLLSGRQQSAKDLTLQLAKR